MVQGRAGHRRLSAGWAADGHREFDPAGAERGSDPAGGALGLYGADQNEPVGYRARGDDWLVARGDGDVLGCPLGWPTAGHALRALRVHYAAEDRRGRTVGGALRSDGHLYFAPVAGGPAFDRHPRRDRPDELQGLLALHLAGLGHLVRGALLRRHQDGPGRAADEG